MGQSYLELIKREHMLEDDNFVPLRGRLLQGLWIVIVPVGELAITTSVSSISHEIDATAAAE